LTDLASVPLLFTCHVTARALLVKTIMSRADFGWPEPPDQVSRDDPAAEIRVDVPAGAQDSDDFTGT
jgi:hypothetical protein